MVGKLFTQRASKVPRIVGSHAEEHRSLEGGEFPMRKCEAMDLVRSKMMK